MDLPSCSGPVGQQQPGTQGIEEEEEEVVWGLGPDLDQGERVGPTIPIWDVNERARAAGPAVHCRTWLGWTLA